jgi:hypothetical protein
MIDPEVSIQTLPPPAEPAELSMRKAIENLVGWMAYQDQNDSSRHVIVNLEEYIGLAAGNHPVTVGKGRKDYPRLIKVLVNGDNNVKGVLVYSPKSFRMAVAPLNMEVFSLVEPKKLEDYIGNNRPFDHGYSNLISNGLPKVFSEWHIANNRFSISDSSPYGFTPKKAQEAIDRGLQRIKEMRPPIIVPPVPKTR